MTYEGDGNHYYDTTFNLRVPFHQNSNGQYLVTVNEVMFKNNEPTLEAGVDYLKLSLGSYVGGVLTWTPYTFKVTSDVFTYKLTDLKDVIDTITNTGASEEITKIEIIDGKTGNVIEDTSNTKEFPNKFGIKFTVAPAHGQFSCAKLEYTDNYAYVLNNMNLEVNAKSADISIGESSTTDNSTVTFWFYNIRLNGSYIYVLDTPITAVSNTLNANNQAYNIVALSYNGTDRHNSTIQMCSSMECTTNDLSNLRIRLLNDQYNPVKVREPIYIQITLTNQG